MKKRALSLLLACFMVVSTFIISKPLAHVHAVDNEQYVEGENMWTLPTDWSTGIEKDANGWDMPYIGNWKLLGYTNLDTAAPKLTASTLSAEEYKAQALKSNGHGKLPGPYLANNANETAVQTTNQSIYDSDGWYTNWNQRWSGKTFAGMATTVGNGIHAIAHANKPGAITFTASKSGLYSFTETVEQILFLANSVNLEFEVTVRKNGAIITGFIADGTTTKDTLAGEVYLKQGDVLMFAFEQTTGVTFSNKQEHKSNDPNCLKVTDVVIKLVSETKTDYSMPLYWQGKADVDDNGWALSQIGNWRLTAFTDPDDISTITWKKSSAANAGSYNSGAPHPWFNGITNASKENWYVNNGTRWANGTIFNRGVEGSYILAIPYGAKNNKGNSINGGKGSNSTALFTAPVTGKYVYSEILNGLNMVDTVNSTPIEVIATVRKNGKVIDTVTVNSDNLYAQNAGTVYLAKGDFLMFTFVQKDQSVMIADHQEFLRLYAADVALVEEYSNATELSFVFDGTSLTDKTGFVELKGYNIDTATTENVGYAVKDGVWYVYATNGNNHWSGYDPEDNYLWRGTVDGSINRVGGHSGVKNLGSAFVFTAPADGVYEFDASMGSAYFASVDATTPRKAWSEYIIMKADGTILAETNNVDKPNNTVTVFFAVAELKAGEQVLVIRKPKADAPVHNISCEGSATITVTQYGHVCSSSTVGYIAAVEPGCEDGNLEHYLCVCGVAYSDANATTALDSTVDEGTGHATPDVFGQSQTEHWKYCANGCDTLVYANEAHTWDNGVCTVCTYACVHEWNAETGVCANCGLGCAHTVTAEDATCIAAAVCGTCGYTYPVNLNNHVSNEFTYTVIDGVTHKAAHKCCGTAAPDEDCVYGDDNVCDKCGYDKTVEVETEDLNNAIDNILNGGNADVEVVGPVVENMGANFDVVKPEVAPTDYEFKYMNIYFGENDEVVLRLTFIVKGDVTVTLNGGEATLGQDEGYNTYYLDITPVAGEYDVANTIVVNGDTYYVSLYSYIKEALEADAKDGNVLTGAEETLLRALYDLNEALR